MTTLERLVDCFATPADLRIDPRLTRQVTSAFARVTANRILAVTPRIASHSDGIVKLVQRSQQFVGADHNWWMPELSNSLCNIIYERWEQAVAGYLFALQVNGFACRWSMMFPTPTRFAFAGHAFTLQGTVAVESDGARTTIVSMDDADRRIVLERVGQGWAVTYDVAPAFEHRAPLYFDDARFGAKYVLSTNVPDGAEADGIDWPPPAAMQDASSQVLATPLIFQAFDALSSSNSAYHWWIGEALRGIASMPLLANGKRHSGSSIHFTGVVTCGFPAKAEAIAETLVHEVSHQYFLLLESTVPLVAPERAGTQIWSTFKERNRPLNRVFLAYHAAANMALYWAGIMRARGVTDYRISELSDAVDHAERMGGDIAATRALSPHGQALFDKLERLVAASCAEFDVAYG